MPKDRLLFAKEGRARYISHLDLMRTFQRAFLRAGIPIWHTEGFNPHPFISIALPLSLGFESRCEILEFGLLPGTDYADVPRLLNGALPEGVTVERCYPAERPVKELAYLRYDIAMECSGDRAAMRRAWEECLGRESWVVEKKSKKAKSGSVALDIIPLRKEYSFAAEVDGGVVLHATLSAQGPGLNPSVMVGAFTDEFPQLAPDFVSYRRVEAMDKDGRIFR